MITHFTRRKFIGTAAAAASIPLLPSASSAERILASAFVMPPRMQDAMDADLLEVNIPRLRALYETKKYTATQVVRWYLNRIAKYDQVYRSILHVDAAGALKTAAAQDAGAKAGGARFARGPLWGVPIVIKANTSVKGLVTSAGWNGYLIPGHELIAPADATIVSKLRVAGAIIIGQTNMPDFAASDTNISSAFGRTGNAYDWRFSPGGSSGGTVTAVTANFCVFGNGTDTGNSIRMPAGTSEVVGFLPTRGLISIAGIHPLNWLLDDTGPIARDVTDIAIALGVMAGEDAKDFRTKDAATNAQAGPYTKYLLADALKGRRFGVPAFIVNETNGGITPNDGLTLRPETREMFMKAVDGLRLAGATVMFDDAILPPSFMGLIGAINTQPYVGEGTETFLRDFGPADYHSSAEYAQVIGSPLPPFVRGVSGGPQSAGAPRSLASDPMADANFWQPQRQAVAAYDEALDRFKLDGFVYPALQMPPNDELLPLLEGRRSNGPHSQTAWVNPIGVPAVSIPAGFYATGLPFGLELSTKRWRDGDLIGWAFAYEQATKYRKPPMLRDKR
jgi:Asp-tRNA(Asn)/Glu-tRNA(Gln) amidotransferase A subunit family amidase